MARYEMIVFPGRAHWEKPIDELCETFDTFAEARAAARMIEKYQPHYFVQIEKRG